MSMASPRPQNQNHHQNQRQRSEDLCFRCHEKGHWARECPKTTNTTPSPKASRLSSCTTSGPVIGSDGVQHFPTLLCNCGLICRVCTSHTLKNPDRKFYCCPYSTNNVAEKGKNCSFFKWFDEVEMENLINVPMCDCGAGRCNVSTESTGPFAGQKAFVCPIKRGQGACGFFRLMVSQKTDTKNGLKDVTSSFPESFHCAYNGSGPANSGVVEACCANTEKLEGESTKHDSLEQHNRCGTVSGLERDAILTQELSGQEDSLDEPKRKHPKRWRAGAEKFNGSDQDSTAKWQESSHTRSTDPLDKNLHANLPSCEIEIHDRQVEFWRQIEMTAPLFSSGSPFSSGLPLGLIGFQLRSSMTFEINGDIALELKGWWGRLAFPPVKCLIIPPPKPFFCGIFPSFDPIPPPETMNPVGANALAVKQSNLLVLEHNIRQPVLSLDETSQQLGVVPCHQSNNGKIAGGENSMGGYVSNALRQFAGFLQREFLTLLKSIDLCDHDRMKQEANITFAALDSLSVDCRPFIEQVREYIRCAASLAEIELAMPNNRTAQELAEHCSFEKRRLDDLSRDHAEAASGLEASREHLKTLHNDVSCLKDMLVRAEAELSTCKEEEVALEAHVQQISADREAAEHRFWLASKDSEEAAKLSKMKEELQIAANAVYEKAQRCCFGQ